MKGIRFGYMRLVIICNVVELIGFISMVVVRVEIDAFRVCLFLLMMDLGI